MVADAGWLDQFDGLDLICRDHQGSPHLKTPAECGGDPDSSANDRDRETVTVPRGAGQGREVE
jgi:hypothetical protein